MLKIIALKKICSLLSRDLWSSITTTVRTLWTDINHPINMKQITIKEKLSKNLEQLGSYIEGMFRFLTKFKQFSKTLLDKSNVKISRKPWWIKAFWNRKDHVSKPQWFGLHGLFKWLPLKDLNLRPPALRDSLYQAASVLVSEFALSFAGKLGQSCL